jgi:hypothetical protein
MFGGMMMGGSGPMPGMYGGGGMSTGASVDYGQVSEGRQRIETAFSETTTAEFHAMPISHAMEYISEIHNLPIRIDELALNDEGVTLDEEITFTISGLSLQNALDLMLENVNGARLDYVIKNDVLLITTELEADEFMETRIYEMRNYQGLNPTIAMQLLREGTSGGWTDVGSGVGAIVPMQGGLMVRQNQRVHREIQALLDQIQQFTAAGLETPSDWLDVEGSDYGYGSMMGGGSMGSGMSGAMSPGMSGGFDYGTGTGTGDLADPMGGEATGPSSGGFSSGPEGFNPGDGSGAAGGFPSDAIGSGDNSTGGFSLPEDGGETEATPAEGESPFGP